MKPGGFGRILAKVTAPFRSRHRVPAAHYRELARLIEERVQIATLDAHAYADEKIAELGRNPPDFRQHLEYRARLASQEAKAYADAATGSLSMALRGMSATVLRLSRRIDALDSTRDSDPVTVRNNVGRHMEADEELRDLAAELARIDGALRKIMAARAANVKSGAPERCRAGAETTEHAPAPSE